MYKYTPTASTIMERRKNATSVAFQWLPRTEQREITREKKETKVFENEFYSHLILRISKGYLKGGLFMPIQQQTDFEQILHDCNPPGHMQVRKCSYHVIATISVQVSGVHFL